MAATTSIDPKVLQDYVATTNSGKYKTFEEVNSKFPELKDYDPQVLKDYVATANSGKYKSWDEINSKFPEFSGKKKAPTEVGSSDSSSGSKTTQRTSGSEGFQWAGGATADRLDRGTKDKITIQGQEFEVDPTPKGGEMTSSEVVSRANVLFKNASPITPPTPFYIKEQLQEQNPVLNNMTPTMFDGVEADFQAYINRLPKKEQDRLSKTFIRNEESLEHFYAATYPVMEQLVTDISILEERGITDKAKQIDGINKELETISFYINQDVLDIELLRQNFLNQSGYKELSSEYKTVNASIKESQKIVKPLVEQQKELGDQLKQFDPLIQNNTFNGTPEQYEEYKLLGEQYNEIANSPTLQSHNKLIERQNQISQSINTLITPEFRKSEEELAKKITDNTSLYKSQLGVLQQLATPETLDGMKQYQALVTKYNRYKQLTVKAESLVPEVGEKQARIDYLNYTKGVLPYSEMSDLTKRFYNGLTSVVGTTLSGASNLIQAGSRVGLMVQDKILGEENFKEVDDQWLFSDKVAKSMSDLFEGKLETTATKTAGRQSKIFTPFYDSETDKINWSSLPGEVADQAGTMILLAATGSYGRSMGVGDGLSIVLPGMLMSFNDALETGRSLYGEDNQGAYAYALGSSYITGMTELFMPDRDILSGKLLGQISKQFANDYLKKGVSFARRAAMKTLLESVSKEVAEEMADRWKDVGLRALINIGGGNVEYDIPTINEQLSIAASTAALTLPLGGRGAMKESSNLHKLAVYNAATNFSGSMKAFDALEAEGINVSKQKEEVTNKFSALSGVPLEYSIPKKIMIAELLEEVKGIRETNNSGISPVMVKIGEKRINEIQGEIENIVRDAEFDKKFEEETNKSLQEQTTTPDKEVATPLTEPVSEDVEVSELSPLQKELQRVGAPQKLIDAVPKDTKLREGFLTDTRRLIDSLLGLAGSFSIKENEVRVGKFYSSLFGGRSQVLIHEAAHAGTMVVFGDILRNEGDYTKDQVAAARELNDIAWQYIENTSALAKNLFPKLYGTTNPYEFIAEFIANPKFRDYIAKNNPSQKTNIVNYIWEGILNMLGVRKSEINQSLINKIQSGIDATLDVSAVRNKTTPASLSSVAKDTDSTKAVKNDTPLTEPASEDVEVADSPDGTFVNVGMLEGDTDVMLSEDQIVSALPEGVTILESGVVDGSEPTMSMKLSRSLTDAEMSDFLAATKQKAIPQLSDKKGKMHGSKEWGEFNGDYFVLPNGSTLSKNVEPKTKQNGKEETKEAKASEANVLAEPTVDVAIASIRKALKPTGIEVVEDPKEFEKAVKEGKGQAASEGMFVGDDGKIYLNREKLSNAWGKTIVFHEGTHPIINIIRNTNKPLYDSVVKGMRDAAKSNKSVADVITWAEKEYGHKGGGVVEDEIITETIARVASGIIKLNEIPTTLKQKVVSLINDIAKMLGLGQLQNTANEAAFVKLANQIADALTQGKDVSGIVGEENVKEFQNKIGDPDVIQGDASTSGTINPNYKSQARVSSKNSYIYEAKEVSKLPVKSIDDIINEFGGKITAINSDPTRVGNLKLANGEEVFMYGGPGYISLTENVNGNVAFASTKLSKVNTFSKLSKSVFGDEPAVCLIVTQTPLSVLGNSYSFRQVLTAIGQLPTSVLRTGRFKDEFFGKSILSLKNSFGEKGYADFINKYKDSSKWNEDVLNSMIEEMAYAIANDNKPASFKARKAFISNLTAGIGLNSKSKTREKDTGYYSKEPTKFIAKQLLDRFGMNQESIMRDVAEEGIVNAFMNDGKWGFAVAGFEVLGKGDIKSVQDKGVTHPLFNAKFPGKNPFFLDQLHEIDKLILPRTQPGKKKKEYTVKGSQMLAGSMYVGGKVGEEIVTKRQPVQKSSKADRVIQESRGGRGDFLSDTYYEPHLTESKDGKNYVFFHVSNANKKSIQRGIDSTKKYSTRTSKEEKGLQYGVASFYTKPKDGERMVGGDKYAVEVPKGKVYPMDTDPNGYRDKAEKKLPTNTPFRKAKLDKAVAEMAKKDGYQMIVGEWNYSRTGKETSLPNFRADALVPLKPADIDVNSLSSNIDKGMELIPHPDEEVLNRNEAIRDVATELVSYLEDENKQDTPAYDLAREVDLYGGIIENYGEPNESTRGLNKEEFATMTKDAPKGLSKKINSVQWSVGNRDELSPKEQIARGVEGIVSKIGAIKNLTEGERTTLVENLSDVLEGLSRQAGVTLKEVIDKFIDAIKDFSGLNLTDAEIRDIKSKAINLIDNKLRYSDGVNFKRSEFDEAKRDAAGLPPLKEEPKQRERSVVKRVKLGTAAKEMESVVEEIGSHYKVANANDHRGYAEQYIERLGHDAASEAVMKGLVGGATAAWILSLHIENLRPQIDKATGKEKSDLKTKQGALLDFFASQATTAGQYIATLHAIYLATDSFYSVDEIIRRADDIFTGKDGSVPIPVKEKLRALAKELDALKTQIDKNKEALAEAEAKLVFERIKVKALEKKKGLTKKPATAKIKRALEKLKTKPLPGLVDENGNPIQVFTAGVTWNDIIDGVIKIIDKFENLIDAINDYLSDQSWYNDLTDAGKDAVRTQVYTHLSDNSKGVLSKDEVADASDNIIIENGEIEVPYSLIKQLVVDGATTIGEVVDHVYNMITDENPSITKRQIRDAITSYGKQRFPSDDKVKGQIAEIKRMGQLVSALEDVLKGRFPLKSGYLRKKPSDDQRAMLRQIREEMKNLPMEAAEIEKVYASVQEKIKTRLLNKIADLTKQLKEEKREKKSRTPIVYNEENLDLQGQIDSLNEALDELLGKEELTHEQKVERALATITRIADELETKISKGDIAYAGVQGKIKDPKLDKARKRLDELRKLREKMRQETGLADKHRLDLYKKKLARDIDTLKEKLRTGDLTKKEQKEKIELDLEGKRLELEKLRLKDEMDTEIEKLRLDNRTTAEVIWDNMNDTIGLPRALMASMDLSAMLRQGAILSFRHPILAGRAAMEQLKFAFSPKYFDAYNRSLRTNPIYRDMLEAGLYLSFSSPKLSAREEQFMNRMIKNIPVLGQLFEGSGRAYTGFLNKMRADVFMDFHTTLTNEGYKGNDLKAELKSMAYFINIASGRGSFGKYDSALSQAVPLFNNIFFAPKFVASRIQVLYHTFTGGALIKTPKARAEFRKSMAIYIGLGIGVLALLSASGAGDVDDDPTSSDFGKLKIGNMRFDIWGGLQQPIVTLMKLILGRVTNPITGEQTPLNAGGFNGPTYRSVVGNFMESKYSPPMGMYIDHSGGRYKYDKKLLWMDLAKRGDKPDLLSTVGGNVAPIWANEVPEMNEQEGLNMAIGGGIASFSGIGVQMYAPSLDDEIYLETQKQLKLVGYDVDRLHEERRDRIETKFQNDEGFDKGTVTRAMNAATANHFLKQEPDWVKEMYLAGTMKDKLEIFNKNIGKKDREDTLDKWVERKIISTTFSNKAKE